MIGSRARLRTLAATWILPILLAAVADAARAGTIHVPLDAPTIRAGLAAAVSGDTVVVACGTWLERGLNLPPGVSLHGETGDPVSSWGRLKAEWRR